MPLLVEEDYYNLIRFISSNLTLIIDQNLQQIASSLLDKIKNTLFSNMITQNSELSCLFETNDLINTRKSFINNVLTSYLNNPEYTRVILNLINNQQYNNKYITCIISRIIEIISSNYDSPQATNFYNKAKLFDYDTIQLFKTNINNIKSQNQAINLNNYERLESYLNNLERENTNKITEQINDILNNKCIEQEDIDMMSNLMHDNNIFNKIHDKNEILNNKYIKREDIDMMNNDNTIFNSIHENTDNNLFNINNSKLLQNIEDDDSTNLPFDLDANHGLQKIFNDSNKLEKLCDTINYNYKNIIPLAKDIINFILCNEKLRYHIDVFIKQLSIQSLQVFYDLLQSSQYTNNDNFIKLKDCIITRRKQLHH